MRSAPLDGLRAIAVIAVLAYHAHYSWAVGGYLGVDVFFVLSGYLITGVLLSTHRSWWGYRDFLLRRAVRLMPALVVALVGVAALVVALDAPADRSRLLTCTAASAGYVMNLPFGEALGCSAPWHITWSLASEQQFYLVWPGLLLGLIVLPRRLARRPGSALGPRTLAVAAVAAGALYVASLGWQLALRSGHVSSARLSFMPDTRSLVLLLGCALALAVAAIRRSWRPRPGAGSGGGVQDVVATGALGLLGVCFGLGALGNNRIDLLQVIGAGTATAVLIAALAHAPSSSRLAGLVGARPMAYLGRISYSLYLWHEVAYRIADAVGPRGTPVVEALRWSLALALAAASYRWVEQPVQRWWKSRDALEPSAPKTPAHVLG